MTKKELQKEYGISMLVNPSEGSKQLSYEEEQLYRKCLDAIKYTFEHWNELDDDNND